MRYIAAGFPVYIHLGKFSFHPHPFFESLAYSAAFCAYLFLRRRFGDPIVTQIRWAVIAAAVAGAAIGAKLLFWLEDPQFTLSRLHDPAYLAGGKTIVGALAFGLLSVELMKRYIGLQQSTGDLYAAPLTLGIAIGRVGCFLTGLPDNTYGTPTALPWGVDFGDGIKRHPTQLYEIVFLLALIPVLYGMLRSITRPEFGDEGRKATFVAGDVFKFFMVSYLSFRLLCDFIKPYQRIFLGLGGIQWVCVVVLLYYFGDIARWFKKMTIWIRSSRSS